MFRMNFTAYKLVVPLVGKKYVIIELSLCLKVGHFSFCFTKSDDFPFIVFLPLRFNQCLYLFIRAVVYFPV